MPSYYANVRMEIMPYLPPTPKRLLELGCAEGNTVAHIKTLHPGLWAAGAELHKESADAARAHFDKVWQGTVEETPWDTEIAPASLDVILCLDILEHLVDPWAQVKRLSPLLAPGGRLIISIPNVRNYKFVLKLLFKGDFRYKDAGILDRTHLRFFTKDTGIELATCGGLTLQHADPAFAFTFPDIRWFWSKLSRKRADSVIAKQWILIARAD